MKRTDLSKPLQRLLYKVPYVSIATVSTDGVPWNTPVVGRFDNELNLYWVSWRNNQHSRNIGKGARIFVVVYDTGAPEGAGQGLYLQMRARPLQTRAEINAAQQIYDTSFFDHPFRDHAQFLGTCPQRFYRAIPEKVWHNSDGREQGHFIDVRCRVIART